ncbi:tyrosine-type recombinase/integrase [Paraburkholderia tropica]|uniref:tyrosine-type recombinase/integrase n=1 Tax=Paraburkholderia tropica TaxID=92647 RepID=UPI002AB7D142|nr:site-specific integrase [Paraburkholderia tropica]
MAYYRKRSAGWQAQVEKAGVRDSETFPTKAQAIAWATKREAEIMDGKRGVMPKRYVSEALNKYKLEVSPKKRGEAKEVIRIEKWERELPFVNRVISEVTQTDIAQWRDLMLKTLKPATVNREWTLLHNIFQLARREWRWLEELPFEDVKRPKSDPHRTRRVSIDERDLICKRLGYKSDGPIKTKSQEAALAFLFAIESGMRAGEILALRAEFVDLERRAAHLPKTKNSDARDVPLSTKACELLKRLGGRDPLFSISSESLVSLFRHGRNRAKKEMPGIATLHFHDSRHEACTQLAKKVSVLELAKIIGHRDLKNLLIYYNPTTEELAQKLG